MLANGLVFGREGIVPCNLTRNHLIMQPTIAFLLLQGQVFVDDF